MLQHGPKFLALFLPLSHLDLKLDPQFFFCGSTTFVVCGTGRVGNSGVVMLSFIT